MLNDKNGNGCYHTIKSLEAIQCKTLKNHKSVDKMVCSSIIEIYGEAKEIENLQERIINEK
jgi:hypothetical protein